MLRVLVISDFRHAHAARPEAEIFLALHRAGLEVEVMTPDEDEYAHRFRDQGMAVHDFRPRRKFTWRDVRTIRQRLVAGGHRILHVLSRNAMTSAIIAARGLPVAVVLYRGASRGIRWYDPLAYFKYLHPRVDAIVCNTQGSAWAFGWQPFFDSTKVTVIPKGHDPVWYEHVIPADLSALGIAPGTPAVACVANVRRVKGVPVLLEAIRQLPAAQEIHFLLIGRGMDDVVKAARLAPADRRHVHVIGFTSDPLPWVAACDVFVLPSLSSEALTKSVLEAMSLGVTPVITDLPGNAALVEHGVSGWKVPPGNAAALAEALVRVCGDPELCTKVANQARQRVATQFHHAATVTQISALYRRLANRDS